MSYIKDHSAQVFGRTWAYPVQAHRADHSREIDQLKKEMEELKEVINQIKYDLNI
jgi:hypothetical protein